MRKPVEKSVENLTALEVRELALDIGLGLTSTVNPDMTAWYCKCLKMLGLCKYSQLATMAKSPRVKDKGRMFSSLLKEEMNSIYGK